MTDVIAVIAQGEMGAAVGRRLHENGARVITSLAGRSAASATRAKAAGIIAVGSDDELAMQADFILSIVPPGDAVALAERLRPALKKAARKPVYMDCNAVAPETAERIGAIIAETGCRYVDAGIIGGPPKANATGPIFYVSGEAAKEAERLLAYGLTVRIVDGPLAAASALKMSYAGITKGFTAIGAAMMLGAARAGCAEALHKEMTESLPQLLAWLSKQVPKMYPKAYRWVAEMEEISAFLDADPAGHDMYQGVARFYERLAKEFEQSGEKAEELELLTRFCVELEKASAVRKSA
jgi:3-hydroxyisobutyrate dehydrogenase-like beta-hydroxyacid dehydrogenase